MSQQPSFTNRQTSLKHFNDQNIVEIPQFLKANDEVVQEIPEIPVPIITPPKENNNNENVIRMKISTLLGFLALITLLVILLFGAGYMVAYSIYSKAPVGVGATKKPAPLSKDKLLEKLPKVPKVPPFPKMPQPAAAPEAEAPVIAPSVAIQDPTPVQAPVLQAPVNNDAFAIEFGTADNLNSAQDMTHKLAEHNLTTTVKESKDLQGRSIFSINSVAFKTYNEAYNYLQKVPKPYSLWGKVVNLNHDGINNADK